MRIFEFQINGEKEWVAANTIIEALQTHSSITGIDLAEYEDEDEIMEIPKDKWPDFKVTDAEGRFPAKTFEQWMKENTKPDLIATTCE